MVSELGNKVGRHTKSHDRVALWYAEAGWKEEVKKKEVAKIKINKGGRTIGSTLMLPVC